MRQISTQLQQLLVLLGWRKKHKDVNSSARPRRPTGYFLSRPGSAELTGASVVRGGAVSSAGQSLFTFRVFILGLEATSFVRRKQLLCQQLPPPPPPRDDRERVTVQGCSLSVSPAPSAHLSDQPPLQIMGFNPNLSSVRPGSRLYSVLISVEAPKSTSAAPTRSQGEWLLLRTVFTRKRSDL